MHRRRLLALGVAAAIAPSGLWAEVLASEQRHNDTVRKALRRVGDDGRLPRRVTHYMHPLETGRAASRVAVQKALEALNLQVRDGAGGALQASHVVAVHGTAFDEFTSALVRLMNDNDWQYDGWETIAVHKPKEHD